MDQRTSLSARRDEVLDRIVDICLSAGSIEAQTDKYFTNTSRIVKANGDSEVTFAVFMRRRVVAALEPTIRLISRLAPGTRVKRFFNEGDLVPSEMKMMEITGSMAKLSEIETLLLQKTGFPCVSANNAYEMCRAIPTAGPDSMKRTCPRYPKCSASSSVRSSPARVFARSPCRMCNAVRLL